MELAKKRCRVCEIGVPPMSGEEEDAYFKEVPSWTLMREGVHKIKKQFRFKDFLEAISFVNKVAKIAEAEGHHPDISISYNKVVIELYTHAVKGLSENDFIIAAKIDEIE
jgi:4a-hydroxytetrahydrobiopterin dehydratase